MAARVRGLVRGLVRPLTGGDGGSPPLFGMWWDNVDTAVQIATFAPIVDIEMDVFIADTQGMLVAGLVAGQFAGAYSAGDTAGVSSSAGTVVVTVDGAGVSTRDQLHVALSDGETHRVKLAGCTLGAWGGIRFGRYATAGVWQFSGVIRHVEIRANATQAPLAAYLGEGAADLNWADTVGTNHGTVVGEPNVAISYDSGKTWADLGVSGDLWGSMEEVGTLLPYDWEL